MPAQTTDQHKRIAKNTLMLYTRQILTLGISLYAVRVTLEVLGVTDYGIYNVVAGIVALFSFLSTTLASATQRFFSFALGQNDSEGLKRIFTTNWLLYLTIAVVALILLETVGLWFVNEQLKVPPDRLEAARWVYQFSVLTFISTILSTPFTAMIIAHEDMHIHAYVSIAEALMRLLVVFLLLYLPWEKLELYAMLVFSVATIRTLIYMTICSRKYSECQYRKFYWDKTLLRDVGSFTGWTLFIQVSTISRNQAVTILLNQIFNPAVVAARAIATAISIQINVFAESFNVGLYPPIIKSYAAGDKANLFSLVTNGSKITFFLLWVFALPLFLQMEMVLHLWLVNVPAEAVLFTRLALIEVLINSIGTPIVTAARAPGKMRFYSLTLGSIQIAIFVAAWIVLRLGGASHSVYIIAIVANVVIFFVRLLIVRSLVGLPLRGYFIHAVLPVCAVITVSLSASLFICISLPQELVFQILSILLSVLISVVCTYFIGLNKDWRKRIRIIVSERISRMATRVFK